MVIFQVDVFGSTTHFWDFGDFEGLLSIHPVGTREQAAEITTKAFPLDNFLRQWSFLM